MLRASDDGAWPAAQARAGHRVLVDDLAERFDRLPTGAWSRPPAEAVVVPLTGAGVAAGEEREVTGFLVVGINPHRAFDERYGAFLDLLAAQVSSGLVNAGSYEAERRRAEALTELDRAKTDFFSNVSHELRTPLTLILGPVEDLRAADEVDPDRWRAELEVVHRNGLRLGRLVNSLLDVSRVQAGRVQTRFEPVDLGAVTGELASVFRSAMERAGLEFVVDTPRLPTPVHLDRDSWEKVVLNLLSNALKYTFTGAVTVRVRPAEGAAVLEVADTGVGIPSDELPRLFERFHRVQGTRGRSGEGSGIGLALVQELVALHGGRGHRGRAPPGGAPRSPSPCRRGGRTCRPTRCATTRTPPASPRSKRSRSPSWPRRCAGCPRRARPTPGSARRRCAGAAHPGRRRRVRWSRAGGRRQRRHARLPDPAAQRRTTRSPAPPTGTRPWPRRWPIHRTSWSPTS